MYPPAWQHQWGRWDWYSRHKRGGTDAAGATGRADMTVTRVGAQQEKTERGRASSRRRARRLALTLGAPALATCLSAPVASAATAPAAALPTSTSVDCDPAKPVCQSLQIAGKTHKFVAGATGGVRAASLRSKVVQGSGPACHGFGPGDTDWLVLGFTDLVAGSSWTKLVAIDSLNGLAPATAATAVRSALVCFEAPYRFFVRPGFRLDRGYRGKGPYRGVLASCATVDSTFPVEARGRIQPLPCVQLTRAIPAGGGGFLVHHVVRIPRDAAATAVSANY